MRKFSDFRQEIILPVKSTRNSPQRATFKIGRAQNNKDETAPTNSCRSLQGGTLRQLTADLLRRG